MKHPDYPGCSSMVDRHGRVRWRFRRKGRTVYLPGSPGDADFVAAYQAAIEGRTSAAIVKLPGAAHPKSFGAAWRLLRERGKWQSLDAKTRANQAPAVEHFLTLPVADGEPELWRDMPVAALRRRHVEDVLDRIAAKHPHKARIVLIGVRKLIGEAMRQEWVDYDVTAKLDWQAPTTSGWKPWGDAEIAKFEARHAIGSQARTAYALALFLGNRRSDVALLRWDQIETRTIMVDGKKRQATGFAFTQHKNRNRKPVDQFLPITPMLAECLGPLDRSTTTVLATKQGEPYAIASLSVLMRDWRRQAGIGDGYSLHGLRKALGGWLDDAEATGGQGQDVLGQASSQVHDIYRVSRKRARNAVLGMEKVVKLVRNG